MPTYYPPLTPTFTDEQAQDAVGAMVDGATLEYIDATPLLRVKDAGITYAKIQDVSATSRVLGRKTAGAGDVEELTFSEVLDFVGSAAQGDILYRNASAWVRLGAGSSGQFLKTNGASANPSWATPGSTPGSTDLAGFLGRYWSHETNVTATGFQQLNVLINFTGVGTTAADIANDGLWLRHTTAAATTGTSTHQVAITSNQVRRRWKAIHVMYMKTYTDITNVRFWFGLFSAAPQATDDLAAGGGHLAAFRYSTAVDGTAFWRTCTGDGATQEEQTTTVAVATDTPYLFRIELDISEVRFYIDGALVTTHSTNLPGIDSPNLGQHVGCTNLNNTNHSFRYGRQWGLLQI